MKPLAFNRLTRVPKAQSQAIDMCGIVIKTDKRRAKFNKGS
jgi:hypothetical protein